MPYHVDRSKLYVADWIGGSKHLDAPRICRAIGFTRFPVPIGADGESNEECLLMRAASIIGQLADPHYLQKAHALYYEFEEIGLNAKFGYTSAADLIEAMDGACEGLRDTGQPALVREIIAKRIIEAAKKGERDPARLRAAGQAALGYDREAI
jgi:hypothetical protein